MTSYLEQHVLVTNTFSFTPMQSRGFLAHPEEVEKLRTKNKQLGSLVEQVKHLKL